MPAKAGIQFLAKALGPRFAGTSGIAGRISSLETVEPPKTPFEAVMLEHLHLPSAVRSGIRVALEMVDAARVLAGKARHRVELSQ